MTAPSSWGKSVPGACFHSNQRQAGAMVLEHLFGGAAVLPAQDRPPRESQRCVVVPPDSSTARPRARGPGTCGCPWGPECGGALPTPQRAAVLGLLSHGPREDSRGRQLAAPAGVCSEGARTPCGRRRVASGRDSGSATPGTAGSRGHGTFWTDRARVRPGLHEVCVSRRFLLLPVPPSLRLSPC